MNDDRINNNGQEQPSRRPAGGRTGKSGETLKKVGYLVPLAFPAVLWTLGGIALYYFGENLIKYQAAIASWALPAVIGLFSVITVHFVLVAYRKFKGKTRIKPVTRVAQVSFSSICVLLSTVLALLVYPHISIIYYSNGPSLTLGTGQDPATGISIMWKTATSTDTTVLLGTDPANMQTYTTGGESTQWHKISINGLQPATKYYYQVPGLIGIGSGVHTFTTAPTGPSNFSFLVFSDTRQNSGELATLFQPNVPQIMEQTMNEMGVDPAFTIVTGDITSEGDNFATWKSWFDDISVYSSLAVERPLIEAIGNHERHNDPNGTIFEQIYPIENRPLFYYSFNYSQVHFTILDPWNATTGWWGGFDQEQQDWAMEDLARAASMDFKVILMHPPPITTAGKPATNMEFVTELCQLHGVDAVFFGHVHAYNVQQVNGTWYFMIGVGGNNAHYIDGTGFARVDVNTSFMNVTMHWINGSSETIASIPA